MPPGAQSPLGNMTNTTVAENQIRSLSFGACHVGHPVWIIWMYKNWKILLARLLTKYTLQYILRVEGTKTKEGNKNKAHSGFCHTHGLQKKHCLLQFCPSLLSEPCGYWKRTWRTCWSCAETTTSHRREKDAGSRVSGRPPLGSKVEFRLQPAFHKAVNSLWCSILIVTASSLSD